MTTKPKKAAPSGRTRQFSRPPTVALVAAIALLAALLMAARSAHALEVRRTELKSGLVVLHVERHNLPLVMLTLLVRAGAIDETAEKAGLASLTASLLEEGTKTRTSTEISEGVEFIGASLDASATHDYTTVSLSILKKDLDKGFEVFSDIVLNPSFPEEEVLRQKALTVGSLRQREEDPSYVAARAFAKALYGDHPYGRVVEGEPETIEALTREDLAAFHSSYYLPNNSVLSIVGDVSVAEIEALAEGFLDGWEKRPPARGRPIPPAEAPERKIVLIDRDLTQASILLGHMGVSRRNPDYYALSVMNYVLGGGGFSSRLMDSIRDRMGLAYSVYSAFSARREAGEFMVDVQTKNASTKTVIEEILSQMRRMREQGATESELDDAKSYLVGSFPRRMDTMRKIADFLVLVEFYGLGLDYLEKYPGLINSVTGEDVLRVARKYLDTTDYVLAVVADQSEAGLEK